MKKRYLVFSVLTAVCLLAAVFLGVARGRVTESDVRDFAAETFRGQAETPYTQLALYITEEQYLTPDGMMGLKNTLDGVMTERSITDPYLLCGSTEKSVALTRDARTVEAVATVYFGDWFALHPDLPIAGGYLDESADTTDFCVLDDLAAWRIFGSTDVCGMELEIDGKIYTVNAVVAADRSVYAPYYGEHPRVYISYASAAVRDVRVTFTSLEAVLPDPYTDAAKTVFADAVASYGEDVTVVTDRFTAARLFSVAKGLFELGVMEGKTYPYYENVARILETKCAFLLLFETAMYTTAAVCFVILAVLILRPLSLRMRERRLQKKRHAIY